MSDTKYKVTDVQIFAYGMYEEDLGWGVNYAINNSFMIQYGEQSDSFSIPALDEASWNNKEEQDLAAQNILANDLAQELNLPKNLYEICETFTPDWLGDEKQIQRLKIRSKHHANEQE